MSDEEAKVEIDDLDSAEFGSECYRHIERFKRTQGKFKITDEMDRIIDEPSVIVVE